MALEDRKRTLSLERGGSILARHTPLLVEEVDDLDDVLLRLVLQARNQLHRFVVVSRHQVPHQYIVLLADDPADFFVVAVHVFGSRLAKVSFRLRTLTL